MSKLRISFKLHENVYFFKQNEFDVKEHENGKETAGISLKGLSHNDKIAFINVLLYRKVFRYTFLDDCNNEKDEPKQIGCSNIDAIDLDDMVEFDIFDMFEDDYELSKSIHYSNRIYYPKRVQLKNKNNG